MLDVDEIDRALDLSRLGYELVKYLQRASSIQPAPEGAHDALSMPAAARAWLAANVPASHLPPNPEDLAPFANLLASYVDSSFDFDDAPRPLVRLGSCGCTCSFCVRAESISGLRPKRLAQADKAKARRLERAYVERMARELGARDESVAAVCEQAALREERAVVTYVDQLLRRLEGHVEGPAVLALWRTFAWTANGSPKPGFRLTTPRVLEAERRIRDALGGTPVGSA